MALQALGPVEQKSLGEIKEEILSAGAVEGHLAIIEAISKTYGYIVKEYNVIKPQARERLYHKIRLNMAYFQLGGPDQETENDSGLDIVIRRKLKEYLPGKIMENNQLFYNLD